MTTAIVAPETQPELLERVVIGGDLSKLATADRLQYYRAVCDSVGLNPLTRPFEYLTLQGKMILYARRDATDQLRKIHGVSITITAREQHGDVYAVVARAVDKQGRSDESVGAVPTKGLAGDALANALMKAETKAKRRVTLSICGLGMLDETEVETVAGAKVVAGEEVVPSVPVLPKEDAAPVQAKVPATEWVKAFEVVTTGQAGRALWSSLSKKDTWDQYTVDEQTMMTDAKNAMKVRLGSA